MSTSITILKGPGGSIQLTGAGVGCMKPGEPITGDGYCEECMRYTRFGYDESEHHLAERSRGEA